MIKKLCTVALCTLFFSCISVAQLPHEQQVAKEKGITLFKQSNWYESQPLLKDAAKAGDRLAQYYLAEAIRLSKRYTTVEAKKWYEAAAEQGDLYAMLRLSNKDDLCSDMGTCTGKSGEEWREFVLKIAHERADNGDTEAMTVLYTANQGLGWLEKAAEAGDSYAQNLLAGVYQDGGGWFFIPGRRENAVKKWLKASAENGYPLGMFHYANYLYEHNGSAIEVRDWIKRASEGGHIDSVSTYARNIAHLPDRLGYPIDLIKGYGLTYLLSKLEGGGTASENGQRTLPKIAEKMTTQEIQQGIAFAKEWEKSHPPLSYFDPIYGF
ncbi:tetratricopeptide repeat protein [Pseudomonas sp. C2B4]|uniref:tetratricopeptide repeat protein n=1 Tax=Pseudomonas sp. C2B4 TaxID=2735270 RepID=UPI001586E814|nr:sel1 repeat family protein [Pseudomonas sp. C2B4]NUU38764.1 sel1 repeat family protein [Pseudomonas sp. C2B4]